MVTQDTFSQNVGIGTSVPRSKLEINGTLRIDTIKASVNSKKVLVQDSATGNVGYISIDSIKNSLAETIYYAENDVLDTTTSLRIPKVRLSISVPPGKYKVEAYTETNDNNYLQSVRVWVQVDSDTLGSGSPRESPSDFGVWNLLKLITLSNSSIIYLYWQNNEISVASIRRTRLFITRLI